ncbi:winged helix-turn-helix transcriptional regulator [Pararhizobium mangrovi]|uniref:Helix-turn-helix transcriptional regulator n=1 Tax=Pararhizobium mangrovi TaxID=2590452 RepID=A0A506U2M6_9HYPH|nr:helix-turn-helix domain-containing protein [Pararhizobium mangrovi]TPW27718.1 helix-turn-helix transcriptional regulator [Pararhizobium mangrovi]
MLDRLYKTQECSAARALEIVGERWSLLILRDAIFRRYTRFTDFQRSLGIATNILAKRLEGFVQAGLMTENAAAGASGHREYYLTEKGRGLTPAIVALTEWGDAWVGTGPVSFRHDDCGGRVRLELHCGCCDEPVSVEQVKAAKRDEPAT